MGCMMLAMLRELVELTVLVEAEIASFEPSVEAGIEPPVKADKSLFECLGAAILTETYLFANFALTAFHQLTFAALCTCAYTCA